MTITKTDVIDKMMYDIEAPDATNASLVTALKICVELLAYADHPQGKDLIKVLSI